MTGRALSTVGSYRRGVFVVASQTKAGEQVPAADSVAEPAPQASVTLTPAAMAKVKELLEREGRTDLRLRVAVQPGGCSGLHCQLFFDDRLFHDDVVIRHRDDTPHASRHLPIPTPIQAMTADARVIPVSNVEEKPPASQKPRPLLTASMSSSTG